MSSVRSEVRLALLRRCRAGERNEEMARLGSPSDATKTTKYNYAHFVVFICEANSVREIPHFSQQNPALVSAGFVSHHNSVVVLDKSSV